MSFSEKVHNRLLALEKQVAALDARLKAVEKAPAVERYTEVPVVALPMEVKRGPGRPKKVVNGN